MILTVLQTHWHSGAPPGVTSSGPVFETQTPIQGASCAPWMVCLLVFEPRAGWCNGSLILALLLLVLACLDTPHQIME